MSLALTDYLSEHLAIVDAQVAGSSAAAGPLNGAKLILATDNFAPAKNSTTASFTQPTTVQFSPPVLTWSPPIRDTSRDIVTLSDSVLVQSANGSPVTVFGYGLTDPGGTNLLLSERFQTPIPLNDALDGFTLRIAFAPANPEGKGALIGAAGSVTPVAATR